MERFIVSLYTEWYTSRGVVINQPSKLHLIRVRWSTPSNLPVYFTQSVLKSFSDAKRCIDAILVAEATAATNRKDIRDGIGISFNPSFRAVGRDSIYGVIRVCTTPLFPCSRFCANTPVNPNITQALLYPFATRSSADLNSCTVRVKWEEFFVLYATAITSVILLKIPTSSFVSAPKIRR